MIYLHILTSQLTGVYKPWNQLGGGPHCSLSSIIFQNLGAHLPGAPPNADSEPKGPRSMRPGATFCQINCSWIGWREKNTGKTHMTWENLWFAVSIFWFSLEPICNQSIETGSFTICLLLQTVQDGGYPNNLQLEIVKQPRKRDP